jgi:hypothetical protein
MGAPRITPGMRLERRLRALQTEAEAVNDKLGNIYNELTAYDPDDLVPTPTCKCCKQDLPEDQDDRARAEEVRNVEMFMSDLDSQCYNSIDTSYIESALQEFAALDASTQDKLAELAKDVL